MGTRNKTYEAFNECDGMNPTPEPKTAKDSKNKKYETLDEWGKGNNEDDDDEDEKQMDRNSNNKKVKKKKKVFKRKDKKSKEDKEKQEELHAEVTVEIQEPERERDSSVNTFRTAETVDIHTESPSSDETQRLLDAEDDHHNYDQVSRLAKEVKDLETYAETVKDLETYIDRLKQEFGDLERPKDTLKPRDPPGSQNGFQSFRFIMQPNNSSGISSQPGNEEEQDEKQKTPSLKKHSETMKDAELQAVIETDEEAMEFPDEEAVELVQPLTTSGNRVSFFLPVTSKYERYLPRDTFSIMLISRLLSISFAWSCLVVFLQLCIYTLVAVNQIDVGASNPLGIPTNVDFAVRLTQAIAITIAVATQEDILTAFNLIYDGYNDRAFQEVFPDASLVTWSIALISRFSVGTLGLIVTFFLIISEETVIELLLNFTAMEFVSHLDEVGFLLAAGGYAGKWNRAQADKVVEDKYFISRKTLKWFRISLLLTVLLVLMTGWGVVVANQNNGTYMCQTIYVQFSDDFVTDLGTYSGLYERKAPSDRVGQIHVEYVADGGKGRFAYCSDENMWTFVPSKDGNACSDWIARSVETSSYDILVTASTDWHVRGANNRVIPLQYFYMACYDCESQYEDICGEGTCVNNRCECDQDSYGFLCNLQVPCTTIAIDDLHSEFTGTRDWTKSFEIMEGIDVYYHPVYIHEYETGLYEIMLFSGRRWAVTYSDLMPLDAPGLESLTTYVSSFHATDPNITMVFLSEAVDVGTPSEAATPVGLQWYYAEARRGNCGSVQSHHSDRDLSANFLCAICNNMTNPCFYDGVCNESTETCDCSVGSSGVLCQVPPLGNGRCDPVFNLAQFSYDGGDCCESTCVGGEFFCGKDDSRLLDIGYFHCLDPPNTWIPFSSPLYSGGGRFSQSGGEIALVGSGKILVVSDTNTATVRAFDKAGSVWIQRGEPMVKQSFPKNGFGTRIAISNNEFDAVGNLRKVQPFYLAVGTTSSGEIHVFTCLVEGCIEIEGTLPGGPGIAFASDILAVGHDSSGNVDFYERAGAQMAPSSTLLQSADSRRGLVDGLAIKGAYCISISKDGSLVAVGNIYTTVSEDDVIAADLQVNIYIFSRTTNSWSLQGTPIWTDGHLYDTFPTKCIVLSGSGEILAIGSKFLLDEGDQIGAIPTQGVQVYSWNGTEYVVRGRLLVGDEDSLFGWSLDLSHDGSRLAVGINLQKEGAAYIRVYEWDGTNYVQLYNDISIADGQETVVALSYDGNQVAVGMPYSNEYIGSTELYGVLSKCPSGTSMFRILIITDLSPLETTWTLEDTSGNILLVGGPYNVKEMTYMQETCLDENCVKFTIYDDGLDGLESPARYTIFVDGEKVASGYDFGAYARHSFGNCVYECVEENTSLLRLEMFSPEPLESTVWAINDAEGQVLFEGGPYQSEGIVFEEMCIPSNECATFSVTGGGCGGSNASPLAGGGILPLNYSLIVDDRTIDFVSVLNRQCDFRTVIGTCRNDTTTSTATPLQCQEGAELLLHVEAFYHSSPHADTKWSILTCGGGELLQAGPFHPTDFKEYMLSEVCLGTTDCVWFTFTGSENAWYDVSLGGTSVWTWGARYNVSSPFLVGSTNTPNGTAPIGDCPCSAAAGLPSAILSSSLENGVAEKDKEIILN